MRVYFEIDNGKMFQSGYADYKNVTKSDLDFIREDISRNKNVDINDVKILYFLSKKRPFS